MTAEFVYNADGLRVQKTVNGVATKYTLHGKNVVHMTSGADELHFFYDAQNRPAVVVYNGVPYAYVKSLQGDIVAILDENGNTVVSYGYDAWGAPLWCTGELAETLGKVQPFRYRGYVFDEETGLYYLRSRYYNPGWGRFVNADACFIEKRYGFGNNLFTYCKNSPVVFYDKNGREYRVVGAGIQLDFSGNCMTAGGDVGIEIICYWDTPEARELNKPIIAVYTYLGSSINIGDYSDEISIITQIIEESMTELRTMDSKAMEEFLQGKLLSFSISGSAMVITANEKFENAYSYEGKFETGTVGISYAKAFKSWSESCEVYGAGVSSQWGLYYSRSNSFYWLLYTNGYARESKEEKEK